MKRKTKAELERENMELRAQLAYVYATVQSQICKANTEHMMASGVLLQLTALGGRQLITPVVIRDGLSDETIDALRKDLLRSYELATQYKPK